MKTLIFLSLLLLTQNIYAAFEISPQWNNSYSKELIINCYPGEKLCQDLCQDALLCKQPEKFCLSCIGTSLMMSYLIGEIGRTIVTLPNETAPAKIIQGLKKNSFVTIGARDVYNVIDASGSIKVIKKFEKLCPFPTDDQVVFLDVDPVTRKVLSPSFVHCSARENSKNFELSQRPGVDIQERNFFLR